MFAKLLDEDFSSYLRISKEDLGNDKKLFAHREVITIMGLNGKYDIGTKMSREGVILENGWAEFSRAHQLCNTDKLMFTCGCHGRFFVLIFDKNGMLVQKRFGPSEAEEDEIVSGHDNRNDKEPQSRSKKMKVVASSSRLPRKRKGTSKQCKLFPAGPEVISINSDSSDNDSGNGQASGAHKPCVKRDRIVSEHDNRNDKEAQSHSKKKKVVESSSRLPRKRKEISDTSDSSDSETKSRQTMKVRLRKTFISNRRPVTAVEEENALRAAKGFQPSRPYFIKQMKRSSVYKDFFVVIPIKFARANLPDHATQMSLRVPDKTEKWEVNCTYRVQKDGKQHVWMIVGGWWRFSLANNLEESDTLVFEMTKKDPIQLENHKIEMNVRIFRVVEEITPLEVLERAWSREQQHKVQDGNECDSASIDAILCEIEEDRHRQTMEISDQEKQDDSLSPTTNLKLPVMSEMTPAVCVPSTRSQKKGSREKSSVQNVNSIALTREKRSVHYRLAAQRERQLAAAMEKKKTTQTKQKAKRVMVKERAQQKEKGYNSKGNVDQQIKEEIPVIEVEE